MCIRAFLYIMVRKEAKYVAGATIVELSTPFPQKQT